jgi:glucokinase
MWPAASDSHESGKGAATALFRAVGRGEPDAISVQEIFAGHLAEAIRLLVLTIDVEVVVLGGGVASVGERLRLAVASALTRQSEGSAFLQSLALPSRVRLIDSSQPIAAIGAALLARDLVR